MTEKTQFYNLLKPLKPLKHKTQSSEKLSPEDAESVEHAESAKDAGMTCPHVFQSTESVESVATEMGSPYTTNSGIYEFYTDVGHSIGEFTGANVPDMAWRTGPVEFEEKRILVLYLVRTSVNYYRVLLLGVSQDYCNWNAFHHYSSPE
ncbi:hypothetical protein EMCRGX_G013907 [Ephydatia muelleri]